MRNESTGCLAGRFTHEGISMGFEILWFIVCFFSLLFLYDIPKAYIEEKAAFAVG